MFVLENYKSNFLLHIILLFILLLLSEYPSNRIRLTIVVALDLVSNNYPIGSSPIIYNVIYGIFHKTAERSEIILEEPTLTVTAIAGWIRTFLWVINKTANPTILNLSPGETGTVQETVSVINDAGVTEVFVEGQVCITNKDSVETKEISCTLELIVSPSQTPVISIPLDIDAHPILQASETHHYPYRMTIPSVAFVPGVRFKVTAHATITNSFGCLETQAEPLPLSQKPLQSVPLHVGYCSIPQLNATKGDPSSVRINCTKTILGEITYMITPNCASKQFGTLPYCLNESCCGTLPTKETLINQTIDVPGRDSQLHKFTALHPPKVQSQSYTMRYTCNQASPYNISCNIKYKLLISTRGADQLVVDIFQQQPLPQQGQAGTTLSETITGTAHWLKTYNWVLAKTADPNVLNLFRSDIGTVNYTITATTSSFTTEAYIEGVVTICNGGAEATVGLQTMLLLTMPPSQTVIAAVQLDVSKKLHALAERRWNDAFTVDCPIIRFGQCNLSYPIVTAFFGMMMTQIARCYTNK